MYLEYQTHYHVLFCRGPTFRTAFQKLGWLRAITKVPIMALTASAPPAFERENVNSLALDNTVVVREQLNRPNIYNSVGKKLSVYYVGFYTRWLFFAFHFQRDLSTLGQLLKQSLNHCSIPKTLIFCRWKETAANIYCFLSYSAACREHVSMYHASLTEHSKREIYIHFSSRFSRLRCLVATIAFGMVWTCTKIVLNLGCDCNFCRE